MGEGTGSQVGCWLRRRGYYSQ